MTCPLDHCVDANVLVIKEGKSKASGDKDDLDGEDDLEDEEGGASKPLRTTFELNDTLYAEAELEDTDTVYLWLGVRFFDTYCACES